VIAAAALLLPNAYAAPVATVTTDALTPHTILYFSRDASNNYSLKVRNPDGSTDTLVSSNLTVDGVGASLGPNAAFAVFTRESQVTGSDGVTQQIDDLYYVDRATKAQRQLTSLPGYEIDPRVSPNGRDVAFTYLNSPNFSDDGLYMVGTDGNDLRRIDAPAGYHGLSGGAWSPDGSRIVFNASNDGTDQLATWVANADGSGATMIRETPAGEPPMGVQQWSPDGLYLFLTRGAPDEQSTQIWVTDFTGKVTQITNDPSRFHWNARVSNDWQMYYIASGNDDQRETRNVYLGEPGNINITFEEAGARIADVLRTGTVSAPPANFPVTAPQAPGPSTCPPAYFIGVRGSGQVENDEYEGFGREMMALRNEILGQIPDMGYDHVNYRSIAVLEGGLLNADNFVLTDYKSSELEGEPKLQDKIHGFHNKCSAVPIVLGGYSQGAHVVGDVYQSLSKMTKDYIAAVVLIGDPRFNKEQKAPVNQGDFEALNGLFSTTLFFKAIPKEYRKPRSFTKSEDLRKVQSYCTVGDPVCNYSKFNAGYCQLNGESCPHVLYPEKPWIAQAGRWAVRRVQEWKPPTN
jgi:hypothetical protein